MDSKYNLIEKNNKGNGGGHQQNNNFGLKRKFSNGQSIHHQNRNVQKKPNGPINGVQVNGNGINGHHNHQQQQQQQNIGARPSILEQRRSLPVFNLRASLMPVISKNPTIILLGETGSGKTTQIPQFLHDFGYTQKGMVAVTQPRRVAAITISTRVSQEICCKIGELVGYTVRFEDVTSKKTKIRFMTDGSLLRESLSDRLLKQYSVIVLDEAHERTINTDVLFGIVKSAQRIRAEKNMIPLKIIIMSATMDVDHFSKYFDNCETIYLTGRAHPVKVMHAKQPQSDYALACMSTLFEIHRNAPPNHDVLIFLTGQTEIDHMAQQIRAIAKSDDIKGPTIRVFALYAQQQQNKQLEAFQPSAPGSRKVILCTNIAETSLTIKGIRYVIDSGMVKRRVYDPETGMDTLKVVKIAQDQAWQRTGRAGRDSPGQCYRTYTMAEYKSMAMSCSPEILRSNISATVLQLLALGINCQTFDFLDKPSPASINAAMVELYQLGALKSSQSQELTELGRNMAKFPLDPRYSKCILSSPQYECLEEILIIVAVLSSEQIFINISDSERRAAVLTAHKKFESLYGDHLTLLNVFRGYQQCERQKTWCHENFLNLRNLSYAKEVKNQLKEICERLELPMSTCGQDTDQVRKCLITGLFNNMAEIHQRDTNHEYLTLASRIKAKIHPSSVLSDKPMSRCVLFTELILTGNSYMRTVTTIEPEWIQQNTPSTVAFTNRLGHLNFPQTNVFSKKKN